MGWSGGNALFAALMDNLKPVFSAAGKELTRAAVSKMIQSFEDIADADTLEELEDEFPLVKAHYSAMENRRPSWEGHDIGQGTQGS